MQDPLLTILCVHDSCALVSHLQCLASDFLSNPSASLSSSPGPALIPRGGDCPSCHKWTLWGDLIRGCYRRKKGALNAVEAEAREMSEETGDSEDESEREPDSEAPAEVEGFANLKIAQVTPKKKKQQRRRAALSDSESGSESASEPDSRKPRAKVRRASTTKPLAHKPQSSKGKVKAHMTAALPGTTTARVYEQPNAATTTKTSKATRKRRVSSPRPRGSRKEEGHRMPPANSDSDVSLEVIDLDGVS